MMKNITWKKIMAATLAIAIGLTTGTTALAAPVKEAKVANFLKNDVKLVDVNLIDNHHYNTLTGAVSLENGTAKATVGARVTLGTTGTTIVVPATFKEFRNGKAYYGFEYNLQNKMEVENGIFVKAATLKKDGTIAQLGKQAELTVGGTAGKTALGTANVDVLKDEFNWNTNTAKATIVTKAADLNGLQLFFATNAGKAWKKANAKFVATENGLTTWTVEIPITETTEQLKIAVGYKVNGKTVIDLTNQAAWKWVRE